MKKELIIFGTGKIADVISYFAIHECNFKVRAFCVDEQYKTGVEFNGLPVVAFENVKTNYPPDQFSFFVAIGYHDMNRIREKKCQEILGMGYELVSIISPATNLPANTSYGWNCFVMAPSLIHPCVKIGNNVFIWSGAMVAHHAIIGDHCWLTSCCNISGNVQVGPNCFFAVNATVGHSVKIGKNCFLGANTLITKNLEDDKVVISESSKPIRLNTTQFLKMSSFSNL
jgi:sugar O-acyltransferase (sialic acid O-acetyltransferase NeuD family)